MRLICKKCSCGINELDFSEEQKLEIWGMLALGLKLFAVEKLRNEYGLEHREAKAVVSHVNSDFGRCHGCDFENLLGENAECPQCGAFNYNFAEPSFNRAFCERLAWALDFKDFADDRVRRFWCDGISHLPEDIMSLSISNLREKREIQTKAWIGENGQTVYKMTIRFGEKSIRNYGLGESLETCIPEGNGKDWITIDSENRRVGVDLR